MQLCQPLTWEEHNASDFLSSHVMQLNNPLHTDTNNFNLHTSPHQTTNWSDFQDK